MRTYIIGIRFRAIKIVSDPLFLIIFSEILYTVVFKMSGDEDNNNGEKKRVVSKGKLFF